MNEWFSTTSCQLDFVPVVFPFVFEPASFFFFFCKQDQAERTGSMCSHALKP